MRNLALVWVLAACLLGCGGGGDSVQSWKSDATTVTLIDRGKAMRVSGRGQMASYGYVGCSGKYFPCPWDSVAPTITGLVIEKGVTVIGKLAFSGFSGLTSVTVPKSVFYIGDLAFAGCTNLTTVTIPHSVISMGSNAWGIVFSGRFETSVFENCGSLTSINVSEKNPEFSSIDGVLFDKAQKTLLLYPRGRQGAYTIPNGVTKINDYTFEDCHGLKSVTIPESVTVIGYKTFYSCRSLTSINADSGNPAYTSIDGVLFNKAKDSLLVYPCGRQGEYTIPQSVAYIENSAFFGSTGLTSIMAAAENAHYSSIDGVLFSKNKTVLIQYPKGRRQGAYTIPKGVATIGDEAFGECENLTSVTLGKGVTSIGEAAFYDCDNLQTITVKNPIPPEIGEYIFRYIEETPCLYVPKGSIDAYRAADGWEFKCIKPIASAPE
jgi:hypothetical protein